jgi:hypothetical protein
MVRAAADVLRSLPMKPYTGHIVQLDPQNNQSTMTEGLVGKPHFHTSDHMEQLVALPQYQPFVAAAKQEPGLGRFLEVQSPPGQPEQWYNLYPLISKALVPDFVYRPATLDALLDRLEVEIARDTILYAAYIYFSEWQPTIPEPLAFAGGYLRPVDLAERAELVNSPEAAISGMSADVAFQVCAVLHFEFESAKPLFETTLPVPLEHYLTALRLGTGSVSFSGAYVKRTSGIGSSTTIPVKAFPPRRIFGAQSVNTPPGTFNAETLGAADRYLDLLSTCPSAKELRQAVRRMSDASDRTNADDAVVDYVVGIESLLTDESMSEVAFKLRLRLAYLIGRNSDDRIHVFNQMKQLYTIRGKIAHGKAKPGQAATMRSLGDDYLRRLIIAVLNLGFKIEPEEIELAVLRGSREAEMPGE